MEKKEKVFANGFIFKRPHEKAPDFVKGALALKADEAIAFIQKYQKNGWVNLDLKSSREGKLYLELDTYEKREEVTPQQAKKAIEEERQVDSVEYPEEDISLDQIPF